MDSDKGMCDHYTVTDFPHFKPRCKLGYKASVKCHTSLTHHACGKYCIYTYNLRRLNPLPRLDDEYFKFLANHKDD